MSFYFVQSRCKTVSCASEYKLNGKTLLQLRERVEDEIKIGHSTTRFSMQPLERLGFEL